jgi:hypothetical protein
MSLALNVMSRHVTLIATEFTEKANTEKTSFEQLRLIVHYDMTYS